MSTHVDTIATEPDEAADGARTSTRLEAERGSGGDEKGDKPSLNTTQLTVLMLILPSNLCVASPFDDWSDDLAFPAEPQFNLRCHAADHRNASLYRRKQKGHLWPHSRANQSMCSRRSPLTMWRRSELERKPHGSSWYRAGLLAAAMILSVLFQFLTDLADAQIKLIRDYFIDLSQILPCTSSCS